MPTAIQSLTSAVADRYAVREEIGRGGMAVVYLAEDLKGATPGGRFQGGGRS